MDVTVFFLSENVFTEISRRRDDDDAERVKLLNFDTNRIICIAVNRQTAKAEIDDLDVIWSRY